MFGFYQELLFEEGAASNPHERLRVSFDGSTIGFYATYRDSSTFVILDPSQARLLATWIQTALGEEQEDAEPPP